LNLFGGAKKQETGTATRKKSKLDSRWQGNVLDDIKHNDEQQFIYDITNFNPYELLTSCNNEIEDSLFFAILKKITKKESSFNMLDVLIKKYPKLKTVSNCTDSKIKNIKVRLNPILYAVYKNDKSLLDFLLNIDKSLITAQDKVNGNCPLGLAALLGNVELTEYLINKEGIDLDQANKKGRTPLLLATGEREKLDKENQNSEKYLEVIKLLQKKGANLTKDDEKGHFPLERLQQYPPKSDPKYTEDLLNYAQVDDLDKANGKGDTAIHNAVNMNNLHHTDLIANKIGHRINHSNKDGKTVTHKSVENGQHDILKNLSKRRELKLSEPDKNGDGPFHKATEGRDHHSINTLLQGPKNTLETKDKEHEDKVKDALGMKNRNGHTPLGISVKNNDFDTSTLLLKNGSNPNDNLDNKEDTSLLGHSLRHKNFDIAQQLVNSGANINKATVHRPKGEKVSPIVDAVKHNNIKKLKFCLSNSANTDVTNSKGQTPLIIACKNLGHEKDKKNIKKTQKVIDDLLKHSTAKDINKTDEEGNSALHYVSMVERKGKKEPHPKSRKIAEDLGQELLRKGADPNIKNDDDQKPENITTNKKLINSIKTHVPKVDYSDTSSLTSDEGLIKHKVCPKKGQKLKIIQTCVDTDNQDSFSDTDSNISSQGYDDDDSSQYMNNLFDDSDYLSQDYSPKTSSVSNYDSYSPYFNNDQKSNTTSLYP
jgi:ankyrin repeat protein